MPQYDVEIFTYGEGEIHTIEADSPEEAEQEAVEIAELNYGWHAKVIKEYEEDEE